MKSLIAVACIALAANAYPDGGMHSTGSGANLSCPVGFQLNGKRCEKPIYGTPTIRCPIGNLVGDSCVTTAPMTQICPIGSVEDGGSCAIVHSRAPQTRCPPGFAPTGNGCQQRTALPLIETCDIGADDGEGCQMVEHAQQVSLLTLRININRFFPLSLWRLLSLTRYFLIMQVIRTYCSAGFHDEGNGCVRVTTYDCSPAVQHGKEQETVAIAQPLPLPGLNYGGHKKRAYKRMLGAKKYNIYSPPIISAPPPSKAMVVASPPVVAPPAPSVSVIGQQCSRRDYAPPVIESSCPEGFVQSADSCTKVSRFEKTRKCANGAPIQSCFDVKTISPIVDCAKGVLVGEVCQFKETIDRINACPAGSTMTGNGDCAATTMARAVCPSQTALQNGSCVGLETAEPTGSMTVPCTGKGCFH